MASRIALSSELRDTRALIRNIEAARKAMEHTGADIANELTLKLLTLKVREAELRLTLFSSRNIEGDDI